YEGSLPDGDYRECDIDSLGKKRGAKRIVYDLTDWDIYYTGDHYESFIQLY
ncbi:MAG: ribonuclease, partial [Lachnospiraceae bacterium]|nr:ribonuclease [Lachnospiraceae bacterium]